MPLDPISPPGARTRVLDAAEAIVRTRGVHSLTLEGAAREAGISKGGLLYHFASKEEIVEAVVNDGVRFVHEAVVTALAATENAPPRDRLEAAIGAHLTEPQSHGEHRQKHAERVVGDARAVHQKQWMRCEREPRERRRSLRAKRPPKDAERDRRGPRDHQNV